MEIGEPQRTWTVEPVEEPIPQQEATEVAEPIEEPEPVAA
jgi:hypothetical protein